MALEEIFICPSGSPTSVGMPTPEVIARFYEGVPVRAPLEGHATPYSNAKAREMVGFAPAHGWRDKVGRAV